MSQPQSPVPGEPDRPEQPASGGQPPFPAEAQGGQQGTYPPPPGSPGDAGGHFPPAQGQYPPAQGQYPPAQGQYPPAQGQYPPAQGQYPPAQGQYPPAQGQYPPAHGQYGPVLGQTGAAAASPPAAKKSSLAARLGLRLVSLLVVLAVGIGFALWRNATGGGDNLPTMGACIKLAEAKDDIEWRKADCKGDDKVLAFYVATVGSGTPQCATGDYLEYTMTDKKTKTKSEYACLIPNWQKDKCYDVDPKIPAPVDCSASAADFKIAGAYDGTADEKLCTADQEPSTFSMPKRTYCYARPS